MGCGIVEVRGIHRNIFVNLSLCLSSYSQYASREQALNAVKELNDSKLDGRKIHCREDRQDDDQAEETNEDDGQYEEENEQGEDNPPPTSSRYLATSFAEKSDKVVDPKRVFVSNLSYQTTEQSNSVPKIMQTIADVIDIILSALFSVKLG